MRIDDVIVGVKELLPAETFDEGVNGSQTRQVVRNSVAGQRAGPSVATEWGEDTKCQTTSQTDGQTDSLHGEPVTACSSEPGEGFRRGGLSNEYRYY